MPSHLEIAWNPDVAALELDGDLDPASAPELRERVASLIAAGTTSFKLDMAGVDFIDSSGLRELMRIDQQLEEKGSKLVVLHPSSAVSTLLTMTGLDQRLVVEA
ncbi:MAG: STAS domain-containing protein [Actinobacteria bacterium]|nr:STAS domain-containing protein [Actinomycetota bacterium]